MIVSRDRPELCQASREQFDRMSVVGRLGIRLYEDHYYPMFAESTTVDNFEQMFKVVAARRADASFLTESAFRNLDSATRNQLIFCEQHHETFPIHRFIHTDYLWARERIEAAYRREFGK